MQQRELKQINDNGDLKSVIAVNRGDHWNVAVDTNDENFAVIRVARGGKREFKTLDAVDKMLKEVGVKSFTVC